MSAFAATGPAMIWNALKMQGMLDCARVVYAGDATERTAWVAYRRPDVDRGNGAQSTDFQIEYQVADLPELAQGDQVVIKDPIFGETLFRVRSAPYVDEMGVGDGHFRKAPLTRVLA